MNIFEKISEVMKRIEYLTKDDKVEFNNIKYKAISEEKVTTTVRKALIEVGIVIVPVVQDCTITELIRTEKNVNQRADVHTKYRIQNIEDPKDYIEVESHGSGVDTQDKAVGKAMTYAYKYMLLRVFAIPTGEDPDKIASAKEDDDIAKEVEKEMNSKISSKIVDALTEAIRNKGYMKSYVEGILQKHGYKTLSDIKASDLAEIKKELEI